MNGIVLMCQVKKEKHGAFYQYVFILKPPHG